MRPFLALLVLLAASGAALAQDKVNFASFDGKDGTAPTQLDGYLFRPDKPGPSPAVDFHGYPGAYHDFDWPNLKRKELTAYTTRAGVVSITGEDPAAYADAINRVQAFLAGHIGLH